MYRLHLKSEPPEKGTSYATREEAFKVQKANGQQATHKISFCPTADAIENWQLRERDRYRTHVYLPVPWWSDYEPSWAQHDYVTNETVYPRFPHMSLKQPGMIAYTPSLEHGIQDRQVTTRPGKYLETFLNNYKHHHEEWVAKCSASATELKVARTPNDIQLVYEHSAVSSCMAGTQRSRRSEYGWGRCSQHPVRVYGNCELGVAYMGDFTKSNGVTARCVVWVDRKIYTRLYGDPTLTAVLQAHGYTYGDLHGAKIPAIHEGDGYLMPYIDGADTASLDRTGKWLILGSDGDLNAQITDGCTSGPQGYECNGCGDQVDADDAYSVDGDYYCHSCYGDTFFSCGGCGGDHLQENGMTEGQNGHSYCDDCSIACRICGDSFAPSSFQFNQRIERQRRRVHQTVCARCDDGLSYWCEDCAALYPPDTTDGRDPNRCTVCDPVETDDAEELELDNVTTN